MRNLETGVLPRIDQRRGISILGVLNLTEALLHCATFLVLAGAVVPLWREKTGHLVDPLEGDAFQRWLTLVLMLCAIAVAVRNLGSLLRMIQRANPLVWLLVGWALASTMWSIDPRLTVRRAGALALTVFYGLALAYRYDPRVVLRWIVLSLGLTVVASLVVAVWVPQWGLMDLYPYEGAWQGVFVHKNALGRWSGLALLGSLSLLVGCRGGWRLLGLGLSALSATTLVGSQSIAALVATIPAASIVAIGAVWRTLRGVRVILVVEAFILAIAGGVLVIVFGDAILAYFNRDTTLTGRTVLWGSLVPLLEQRWLFGYGYGAFWSGQMEASTVVWSRLGWMAPHAHNFYLDSVLDFGVIGLLVWAGLLVLLATRGVRLLDSESNLPVGLFGLTFAMFALIYSLAESTLLRWNTFGTALLIWVIHIREGVRNSNSVTYSGAGNTL